MLKGEFIECLNKNIEDVQRALMYDLMMDKINEAKKKKEKERKHLYNLKRNKFKRR